MKSKNIIVSIIIRTKNEERWIKSCFDAIFNQTFINFEIIVVDNNSSDKTINKINNYNISKILTIDEYFPGKALNIGIAAAEGKYIVCLSAHCIPKNKYWLETLVNAIEEDKSYAGVYGRQEPMSFSSPSDKRDLMLVFGLDRKIQIKDSFFHNANSIIKKECWNHTQFDSEITNIEDRIWAQKMLDLGYKILYEPDSIVLHYHGIHQNGNSERLKNVVNIIEKNNHYKESNENIANSLNIYAIIPLKGNSIAINNTHLLKYTIDAAKSSKLINKIIVSTDSEHTKKIAENEGAFCPFLRPKNLSEPNVNLETVQNFTLEQIESRNEFPDLIVHLEETYPFRPDGIIDQMISNLLLNGYDTLIAGKEEPGWMWKKTQNGYFNRIDVGDVPRNFKESSFIGLHGICCITYPEFIRKNSLLGEKIGIFKIDNPLVGFEIRDKKIADIAQPVLKAFFNES